METWATERLNALLLGATPPPVIQTMQLEPWTPGVKAGRKRVGTPNPNF